MKIVAVPCKASELKPGDLFSAVGPEFWDQAHLGIGPEGPGAIGVKVYIRTEVPYDPMSHSSGGGDIQMFRLHVVPTKVEQALSEEALYSLVHENDTDPIEPKPKLEVVPDAEDLESE